MNKDNEKRIWGHFTVLHDTGNVKVKELVVKPSHCLSYQRHEMRSEHWVIQSGVARVVLNPTNNIDNDRTQILKEGDTITIPVSNWHQVINIGKEPLIIVETQYGTACDEDDIERRFQ
jgi:mannose-6-phosphate isomerase-like protein (cupin superfamily)